MIAAASLIYTDPNRALVEFERLSAKIISPPVSFGKAWALHLTGSPYGKVLQALEDCEEWEDQAVAVLRGEAFLAGGKDDRARTEYLRALEMGDESQSLARLAELKGEPAPAAAAGARKALAEVLWLVR